MATPKVTIGICFRNPGSYFHLALRSIFAQTFQDWELILLNDISTDGSLELAEGLQDRRVRVINDGKGTSFNIRLNEMIELARGRYFIRMDADDVMLPERLERQLRLLEGCDDRTVIGSSAYSIDRESHVVGFRPAVGRQRTDFGACRSFHHPTVAASTAWFQRHKYSENYLYQRAEDAELWCRTSRESQFITLPEPLLFYREGSSSMGAYLQTQFVLLHILREYFRRPTGIYIKLLSRELGKLCIAYAFDILGRGDTLVRRRYQPLSPAEAEKATGILNAIKAQRLPGVDESCAYTEAYGGVLA